MYEHVQGRENPSRYCSAHYKRTYPTGTPDNGVDAGPEGVSACICVCIFRTIIVGGRRALRAMAGALTQFFGTAPGLFGHASDDCSRFRAVYNKVTE